MGTVSAIDVEDVVWQRIDEQATVGEVRRTVARLAGSIGISEARVAEISVAVSELATNSVLHATGGVALVRCRRNDEARVVELIVIDSGPGIDAKTAEQLFQPFFTTKSSGMGLGLSICKSIIEAHGGQLTVASREPQGAVFRVELPRHRHARKSAGRLGRRAG